MDEENAGPYRFELQFRNTKKLKERDLFFKFIFDDYAMRDPWVGYSASDYDESKNTTAFGLEFDDLSEIFRAGYEFALFVEKEKNKLHLIK